MVEPVRTAMTKADLIGVVAKRLDITQVQAGIIVEAALRSIVSALQNGHEVEIRGFGSFRFRNRAALSFRDRKSGGGREARPLLQKFNRRLAAIVRWRGNGACRFSGFSR